MLLEDRRFAASIVVEQGKSGCLYYDLMIDPPKEKAMLDFCEVSPDYYSGHLLDSN